MHYKPEIYISKELSDEIDKNPSLLDFDKHLINKKGYLAFGDGIHPSIHPDDLPELWAEQDRLAKGTHRSRNEKKGHTKLLGTLMNNLFKGNTNE